MAKEAFKWDETEVIGKVGLGEKKAIEIELNTREDGEGVDHQYISLVTKQFFKKKGETEANWNITKNATFPIEAWHDIVAMINDYTGEAD